LSSFLSTRWGFTSIRPRTLVDLIEYTADFAKNGSWCSSFEQAPIQWDIVEAKLFYLMPTVSGEESCSDALEAILKYIASSDADVSGEGSDAESGILAKK
jgi:hypothetical protein